MAIQRTIYKGDPIRCWLKLSLRDGIGVVKSFEFLADTGSPFPLVLPESLFETYAFEMGESMGSNFGIMRTGWANLCIPALGFDELVRTFESRDMTDTAMKSHPDFVGLVGLPILRRGQYGGDANSFWFRYPPSNTPSP